ncbi:cell envelope integrity protein CreD [Edaphovirga cremea]|uniref:cell envelope integrity protein CreD n=1 Tax=Edaphovirga cremea TaxID=2267246 RepID=UPI0039894D8A
MFKSVLFWKITALLGLISLMLLPVSMLRGVIIERSLYQQTVVDQVGASTSRSQKVLAPLIVLPYEEWSETERDGKIVKSVYHGMRMVLPETLAISGAPKVEQRKIGIYQTQIYHGPMTFTGKFETPKIDDLLNNPNVQLGQPFLVVALSDPRGIQHISPLKLGQSEIAFEPGTRLEELAQGTHAPIALSQLKQGAFNFAFEMNLVGTHNLSVVPLGRMTELKLSSNWPHPNFLGEFLPEERQITDKGFEATWRSSWFANNINDSFASDRRIKINNLPAFSASLIEPVDHYQLSERAVKYAVLFIGLTFMAFFLFETLTGLRVHPIQYLLVGFALVLFYLVLLAFSEHIGFAAAYLLASLTCSALIGFYLSSVLQGWLRGGMFTAGLLLLYGILFLLLQSQDNALVLGSVMLFAILATVMLLTRRLDWYRIADTRFAPRKTEADTTEIAAPASEGPSEDKRFRLWE